MNTELPPGSESRYRHITLEIGRLILRPFEPSDVARLRIIAGERRIADTTISVPHPFADSDASAWIEESCRDMLERKAYGFAIVLRETGVLIGYGALRDIDTEHAQAEISFWISGDHEGKGYVTEAVDRLITFAFETLNLNRLCAFHMVRNSGSKQVLQKLGFVQEGYLRQRVRKWGVFEDVLAWSRLRTD